MKIMIIKNFRFYRKVWNKKLFLPCTQSHSQEITTVTISCLSFSLTYMCSFSNPSHKGVLLYILCFDCFFSFNIFSWGFSSYQHRPLFLFYLIAAQNSFTLCDNFLKQLPIDKTVCAVINNTLMNILEYG
jgi:hypothetical protein